MHRKQNRDPNRSTQTTTNYIDKKLNTHHNNSLNAISSTQQFIPSKNHQINKNSQILAEIKQSKSFINTRNPKQPQPKQSLSTNRNNYKPKFILKDLMQEKQLQSQDSESKCEEYFIQNQQQQINNLSNTFNNSPLASEAYYKFNPKNIKSQFNEGIQARNKSAMLSKRNYLEDESKKYEDHESTRQYDMPVQVRNQLRVLKKTQEASQDEDTMPEFYQEASTVQYSHNYPKKSPLSNQPSVSFPVQSRVRSVSTTHLGHQKSSNSPTNYKLSYLETKKQLEIRQACFSEAMELCRHIMQEMKGVLEEEYCETESQKVMWCHQKCVQVMGALNQWKKH